jgi:hypothetical protein
MSSNKLVFDGDRASATLTVTAPAAPFTVLQRATCSPPPTVNIPSKCTITEVVTNTGGHPILLTQVLNHLAPTLQLGNSSAAKGRIGASRHTSSWTHFRLALGQRAVAHLPVSFTPTQAQGGKHAQLSLGIAAMGFDVVTGQRYTVIYGTLDTPVLKLIVPATGAGGSLNRSSTSVARLPATGGGATR